MLARIFFLMATATLALACGCGSSEQQNRRGAAAAAPARGEPLNNPSTQMTTYTGLLRGGMMAIGGETTGWSLARDGGVGQVDLDVSQVLEHAKRLEGERVTVSGRMTTRTYTERGDVPVLAVEKIIEAAPPL